ncbi:MAG: amidohydrolase [Gemmatimonadetes bacterium]|nr:amidohydrolase [Gemmatimonadota bacterium]
MAESKPLLVAGATVHTLAGTAATGPPADAVLVAGGRIAAVGRAAERRRREPAAEVLELPGATLTPGLTDAHVHLTEWAAGRSQVDLGEAASLDAALGLLERAGASAGWVLGRGWNPHRWGGQEPGRELLDAILGDRPVALQSHDMHTLWVSSAALEVAGITPSTPDPEGGRIVRDAGGRPTGLLVERAGELVIGVIPKLSEADVVSAVRAAQPVLHAHGITGVHSLPGIALPEPGSFGVLSRLFREGGLRLRILQHIRRERLEAAIEVGAHSGGGGDWIRTGGVKLFLDGALGSRTAWLRAPYQDSDFCGVPLLPEPEFRAIVERAARAGIATAVHAIGDAAVSLALTVLADPAYRVPALPHRIEHVQCLPPERVADAARAGSVCSMQPCHLITDWRAADRHWGAERARLTYAFGSLARAGTVLAFGSDAPVEPIDPRRGLFAAVQRQDLEGEPPGGWYPAERVDARTALRGFTTGPAYAAGLANVAGALAPGAFADIVAWDRDPLACPAAELLQLRARATLVGGELVHC